MSLLKNAKKTDFKGVYKKEINDDDTSFIIRYTVNKKTKTKIVGKTSDNMTLFLAYKIKLEQIAIERLSYLNEINGIKESQFNFVFLYKKFIAYRKPFLAKNTNQNYQSHLNQYFVFKFENTEVQTLTKNDLQLYVNSLLEIRRPATVDKIKNTFKQFYKYLIDQGIVSYNPAENLILPKYDNKKYFSLPKKDVKKLINYIMNIKNLRTKTIYMFLLHGRRINEVLSLKIENINFLTGIYKLEAMESKTKKTKFWKLEKFQLTILINYYEQIKNENRIYLFENIKTKKNITYTTFYRIHQNLKDDLFLDNFTLHNFRHLIGFLMINNGYSLEVIARVLGHSNIVSTQRYSELKINIATNSYSKMIKEFFN